MLGSISSPVLTLIGVKQTSKHFHQLLCSNINVQLSILLLGYGEARRARNATVLQVAWSVSFPYPGYCSLFSSYSRLAFLIRDTVPHSALTAGQLSLSVILFLIQFSQQVSFPYPRYCSSFSSYSRLAFLIRDTVPHSALTAGQLSLCGILFLIQLLQQVSFPYPRYCSLFSSHSRLA